MRSCTGRCSAATAELALIACLAAGGALAAPCEPARIVIDRGETQRLVLCGAAAAATYRTAAPVGVTVRYLEPLRQCGVGDRRAGAHIVLEAGSDAVSGALTLSADAAAPACDPVSIEVPDRVLLPAAELRQRRGGLILKLHTPPGLELGDDCAGALGFPAGDGMQLAPGRVPAPRCSRHSLEVAVSALDERPGAAKIVVPVAGRDGIRREAIAWARPPRPQWLDDMREADARHIDVLGVRTRYFEAGSGPPMVLVHGGQPSSMDGTAWDWQQNFRALSRHFRVLALDRLGQGYTDHPADLDDYRDYYPRVVAHLGEFLRLKAPGRVHLVGHSQGSWPVTRLALDQPERIASLTLVDGTMVSPSRDAGAAIRFYLYLSGELHPPAGETLESARRGMALFSYTGNNLTDQRVERLVAMTRQPKYAAGQAWFAKSGMSPAHPSFRRLKQELLADLEAGRLKVPVLVVWGANDPEGSLASGLELFRLVGQSSPDAQLHVFARAGHLSFIEYPQAFNRVLIDFATASGD